jgi:hypothetical protein
MNVLGRAQTNSAEAYPTSHASCFEVRLNVLSPIIILVHGNIQDCMLKMQNSNEIMSMSVRERVFIFTIISC